MVHRGPDDEGYFSESFTNGSIGLAMRRLSIIDLSTGHQPITNETDDVVVVYNGETYNFQDLRSELEAKGHIFKTNSDTEVIVHGYEVWGDEVAAKLNGMFGFAIWDKKKERLVIARDRMGIKPVYYAMLPHKLVFGSEIKAILADPTISQEIDPVAVHDYLCMRYVPAPRSIYKSIRKLEPATLLIWEKGAVRFRKYWDYKPSSNGTDKGLSYYMEKLDGLFDDAIKRQLVADVSLGTFLSGGLDSPTVTYYAKKHKPDLMSFNIYFSEKSFSEREGATQAARFLKTHHVEQEVTPHVQDIIPHLIDAFDEPFGDDSMVPTYFLTKLARQHMTVALSGDGGDELFGGYLTYVADKIAGVYKALPHFLSAGLIEPVVNRLPSSFGRMGLDYKAKAFVAAAKRSSPYEHYGWTEIFGPLHRERLYSTVLKDSVKEEVLAQNFVRAYEEAAPRQGLERFLYVDQKTHLADEFLVKVDRMSMANSLEVRPPFLDHRIVEFAADIPARYKLKGMTTKYILRRLMKGRLPDEIIHGAKKGFAPPTATWLATDLRDYVKKKFSPDRIKDIPYLNPEYPAQLLEQHVQKRSNLGRRLWALLMFVEWYDRKVLGRD